MVQKWSKVLVGKENQSTLWRHEHCPGVGPANIKLHSCEVFSACSEAPGRNWSFWPWRSPGFHCVCTPFLAIFCAKIRHDPWKSSPDQSFIRTSRTDSSASRLPTLSKAFPVSTALFRNSTRGFTLNYVDTPFR